MALLVILASAVFAVMNYQAQITGRAVLDTPDVKFLSPNEYPSFDAMPLTYSLEITGAHDDEYEKARIRQAFALIEDATDGAVRFKETTENAQIRITSHIPAVQGTSYEVRAEGDTYPHVDEYNQIQGADITFYPQYYSYWDGDEMRSELSWKQISCDEFPLTEVHEILHVLGFGHTLDSKSIMAPMKNAIQSCTSREIDPSIVSCLKGIYGSGTSSACAGFDMFPWEAERQTQNIAWQHTPITYTARECSSRQQTLLRFAETRIENELEFDLYAWSDANPRVVFQCNRSIDSVVLNEEVDYWDTGVYFPAAQPFYETTQDKLSKITIILFSDTRNCGGIEMHEFLHAAGIRNHPSIWTQHETHLCGSTVKIQDETSIKTLKEMYSS